MKLLTLSCHHCGGPLEIREGVESVTCPHCATTLAVVRRANGVVTEARVGALVELHLAIARLDEEWERRRIEILGETSGGPRLPDRVAGSGLVLLSGIVLVVTVLTALFVGWETIWIGGLIAIAIAVGGLGELYRAASFREAQDEYRRERENLERGLAAGAGEESA